MVLELEVGAFWVEAYCWGMFLRRGGSSLVGDLKYNDGGKFWRCIVGFGNGYLEILDALSCSVWSMDLLERCHLPC